MSAPEDQPIRRAGCRELALAFIAFLVLPGLVLHEPLLDPGVLVTEYEGNLVYHLAVRNADRYGLARLGGVPMLTAGVQAPEDFRYWTHHPPLLFAALHLAMRLGGDGPLPGRVLMLVCQALTATALYALLRRRFPPGVAAFAGLVTVLARGFLRHGLLVEIFSQPLLLLTTLTVLAWVRFDERPSRPRFLQVLAAFVLAAASNWQALLLSGFLVIDRVAVRRRLRTRAWVLPGVALAIFASWTLWTAHQSAGSQAFSAGGLGSADTLSTFAARVNEGPVFLDRPRIGPVEGAAIMARTATRGTLGWIPLALAAVGALDVLRRLLRRRADRVDRAALLLVLSPATFLAMFSRGAVIHPFWTLGTLAGLATFAGLGAGALALLGRRLAPPKLAAAALGLLLLATLGLEVQRGRATWQRRLPGLRADQARLDAVAALTADHLGPGDHLVVTGHELRADALSWMLDRTVHGNLSAVTSLEALRRERGGDLLVALPYVEAGRLPRLVIALLDAPFARLGPTEAPLFLFDLRRPPRLEDRAPPGVEALVRGAAAGLPDPPRRVELVGEGAVRRLRVVPPEGRVVLFAGTRADHLAPLHEMDAGREIPIERFPPGRWFLAAATKEISAGGGSLLSAVTDPLELSVPLAPGYARRAGLVAGLSLLLGAVAYGLLAWLAGRGAGARSS